MESSQGGHRPVRAGVVRPIRGGRNKSTPLATAAQDGRVDTWISFSFALPPVVQCGAKAAKDAKGTETSLFRVDRKSSSGGSLGSSRPSMLLSREPREVCMNSHGIIVWLIIGAIAG